MKEFLSQRGVTFTEKVVDEDDQAYDELLQLGYRTIPVTLVEGQAIKGFDPAALARALGDDAQSS